MRDIGSANVQGTLYDLLSPRVVGDYIENIGAACQNPDGYAANKIFVAYDSSMNQHLYKTTAQITQGTQITSSNCEQTSLSELLSGSGSSSSLEDLSDTDISSKTAGDIVEYNNSTGKWENTQKLVNLEKSIAPVEDGATLSQAYAIGEKFIRGGVRYKAKTDLASGTQFSSLIINTNYEAADDVSSEIQTLTNNLSDEVETRATLGAHNLYKFDLAAAKAANTSGTWNDNVYTVSGATFTVNDDDTITVNTNGTTTQELYFKVGTASLENGKQYKILGCPSGGSNNSYLMAYKKDNSTYAIDTGNGASFTYASTDNKSIEIYIRSGQNLVDAVFKPMICVSTDKVTTYQPYAMTNRELTENVLSTIPTKFIKISSAEISDSYNPITIAEELVATNSTEIVYVQVAANANITNPTHYCPLQYTLYEIRHTGDTVTLNAVAYNPDLSNAIYVIGRSRNGSWGNWSRTTMTAVT